MKENFYVWNCKMNKCNKKSNLSRVYQPIKLKYLSDSGWLNHAKKKKVKKYSLIKMGNSGASEY